MYEFNLTLKQPFDQAMETVREALMGQHLGVDTLIEDVRVFHGHDANVIARDFGFDDFRHARRVIDAEGAYLVPGLIVRQIPDNAQSIVAVFVTAC